MKFLLYICLITLLTVSFDAFAQEAAAPEGPGMGGMVIQLLVIFLIFWLLIIKPQQKKIKAHKAMTETLKRGDKVITGGGIIGVVAKATDGDKMIQVEISDGVKVEILRSSVSEFLEIRPLPAKKSEPSLKKTPAKKSTAKNTTTKKK